MFFVYKAVEKALLTCRDIQMDIERMIETFRETHDFQQELLQSYSTYLRARKTRLTMRSLRREVLGSGLSKDVGDWYRTYFMSLTVRLVIYFQQLIMIDRWVHRLVSPSYRVGACIQEVFFLDYLSSKTFNIKGPVKVLNVPITYLGCYFSDPPTPSI